VRKHPTYVPGKLSKKVVFFWGKVNFLTASPHLAQVHINDDFTNRQPLFVPQNRLPVTEARSDPSQEFIGIKRLSYVIISALI
jgi:hypothetical protein